MYPHLTGFWHSLALRHRLTPSRHCECSEAIRGGAVPPSACERGSPEGCTRSGRRYGGRASINHASLLPPSWKEGGQGDGPATIEAKPQIAGLQRAPTSGRGSRECPPASATHCPPPFPYAPQPATISHATRLIPPRQKRQAKARRHQTIYQNPDARHKIPHFSAIILKSFKDQTQTPESNQSLRH